MNLVGPKIKSIRKKQKLTQEQLVARCNVVGWNISRGTLAKIEAKVRRMTDIEIVLICKALKIKEQELFN